MQRLAVGSARDVARLMQGAWKGRNRRRRSTIVGLLLTAAAILGGILIGSLGWHAHVLTGAAYRAEPSKQVVARTVLQFAPDPALGKHCAVLNSLACDSVTVQLFLKKPAKSVVASIYGRTMALERGDHYAPMSPLLPRGGVIKPPRAGTAFSGQLDPSMSNLPVVKHQRIDQPTLYRPVNWHRRIVVRLRILYRDGSAVSTKYRSTSQRSWDVTAGT